MVLRFNIFESPLYEYSLRCVKLFRFKELTNLSKLTDKRKCNGNKFFNVYGMMRETTQGRVVKKIRKAYGWFAKESAQKTANQANRDHSHLTRQANRRRCLPTPVLYIKSSASFGRHFTTSTRTDNIELAAEFSKLIQSFLILLI